MELLGWWTAVGASMRRPVLFPGPRWCGLLLGGSAAPERFVRITATSDRPGRAWREPGRGGRRARQGRAGVPPWERSRARSARPTRARRWHAHRGAHAHVCKGRTDGADVRPGHAPRAQGRHHGGRPPPDLTERVLDRLWPPLFRAETGGKGRGRGCFLAVFHVARTLVSPRKTACSTPGPRQEPRGPCLFEAPWGVRGRRGAPPPAVERISAQTDAVAERSA